MKKFLLALSSVLLFAGSLSAQPFTINKFNALPTGASVFAKDEVRTVNFDTTYSIFSRNFDSSTNLGFTNANFNGYGGTFVWDSTLSVHNGDVYATPDSSGFLIMDSEALTATDTQRVFLTSSAISTQSVNGMELVISHYYHYSVNDSIAAVMISKNGTTWALLKDYTTAALNVGGPLAFVSDTLSVPDSFLNQNTVYIRFVYATTDGGQWAIDKVTAMGTYFNPGYAFFKPGGSTAKTWDLSNIQYDGGYRYYARKPAPSPYRFVDSLYNEDLAGLQHTTYGLNYFTTDGVIAHAHLTYAQTIDLNQFTSANDTLLVPVQFHLPYVKTPIPYSAFHIKYAYPMAYATRWNSDYSFTSQFYLKGGSFPIPGATNFLSCYRKARFIEKDTVVGYGYMRVKDVNGNISSYDSVLQLKTLVTQIDSFWVDTTVNQASLRWSLFQNYMDNYSGIDFNGNGYSRTRTYSTISYMRKGALHPLVQVFLQDTFINRIEVFAQPWPVSVEEVAATEYNDVSVYPNPVFDRTVNISIPAAARAKWNCTVVNALGQTVISQPLDLGSGNDKAVVNIPSVVAPGMYFLHITKDEVTYSVKPIQVQN